MNYSKNIVLNDYKASLILLKETLRWIKENGWYYNIHNIEMPERFLSDEVWISSDVVLEPRIKDLEESLRGLLFPTMCKKLLRLVYYSIPPCTINVNEILMLYNQLVLKVLLSTIVCESFKREQKYLYELLLGGCQRAFYDASMNGIIRMWQYALKFVKEDKN